MGKQLTVEDIVHKTLVKVQTEFLLKDNLKVKLGDMVNLVFRSVLSDEKSFKDFIFNEMKKKNEIQQKIVLK